MAVRPVKGVTAQASRDQLLEQVWGYDYLGDTRFVDAHVHQLRNEVEDDPQRRFGERWRPVAWAGGP